MILSTAAVAKLIEVPEGTLRYWRYMDEGPRSLRLGRHVKYHSEDVEEWVSRGSDPSSSSNAVASPR